MTDEELIRDWKKTRNIMSYRQLKNRHSGMVHGMVNRYSASSVPRTSLEAEAWKNFDEAVERFDPDAGAKFSTFLNYQIRKIDRHTKKYQNIARIPEALSAKIGDYDRHFQEQSLKLKRQPTQKEMAKLMGIPQKHVKQLVESRRSDLWEGKFEGEHEQTIADNWLLEELREELNPQEQEVYDYLIGFRKKKISNKKDLAKKLNMSPGRISQITRNISTKIQPHLKKHL